MKSIEQLTIFKKKEGKMTNKKDDIKTEDIIISDKNKVKTLILML